MHDLKSNITKPIIRVLRYCLGPRSLGERNFFLGHSGFLVNMETFLFDVSLSAPLSLILWDILVGLNKLSMVAGDQRMMKCDRLRKGHFIRKWLEAGLPQTFLE